MQGEAFETWRLGLGCVRDPTEMCKAARQASSLEKRRSHKKRNPKGWSKATAVSTMVMVSFEGPADVCVGRELAFSIGIVDTLVLSSR